jgi:uncharacterized protein YkwD
MNKRIPSFVVGLLCGAVMFGGVTAVAADIIAKPTWQKIYVDGQQVQMEAYNINGNNYVKLRDIGKEVGFNVYWQNGVQVDSTSDYTGEAPAQSSTASSAASDIDAVRQEMVQLINQVRKENGLTELPTNESLMNAAQDCSAQGFTSHNQQYEWTTLASYGWPYGGGFNLARLTSTGKVENIAQRAVNCWVNSSGHLQTMLRAEASCLGVGVTVIGNTAYCYMIVGDPTGHNPLE